MLEQTITSHYLQLMQLQPQDNGSSLYAGGLSSLANWHHWPSGLETEMEALQQSNLMWQQLVVRCNAALLARHIRTQEQFEECQDGAFLAFLLGLAEVMQWGLVRKCQHLQQCPKIQQQIFQSSDKLRVQSEALQRDGQSNTLNHIIQGILKFVHGNRSKQRLKFKLGCLGYGLLQYNEIRKMSMNMTHPQREQTCLHILNHPDGIQKVKVVARWANQKWLSSHWQYTSGLMRRFLPGPDS